jgi:replicative DNA helicase
MAEVVAEHEYELRTPDGVLVATKHRRDFADHTKSFFYTRSTGQLGLNSTAPANLPMYRSEQVAAEDWVVIAEGEKAADWLAQNQFPALGTAGSGSTPSIEALTFLRGKQCVLWPDADAVGAKHMQRLADRLHQLGISVAIVRVDDLPDKADAADVEEAAALESYIKGAEDYEQNVTATTDRPHVWTVSDMQKQYERRAADQWETVTAGRALRMSWGFERLDEITEGIPQGIVTIHGSPGVGKTSFALTIAAQCHAPALYLTTEMTPLELWRRLVAQTTSTPMRELLRATLTEDEEAKLNVRTVERCGMVNFVDASVQHVGVPFLEDQMRSLRTAAASRHALLVLDSLSTWVDGMRMDTEVSEYNAISEGVTKLRDLANELQISVILIAERNRASMKDGGLSSVAGSRRVEYGSDLVIALDVNADASDPHGVSKAIDLRILKNRNGYTSSLTYNFVGSLMQWAEN